MTQPEIGTSNMVLYSVLFAPELGDDALERVARDAIESFDADLTAQRFYAGISEALTSDAVLTEAMPGHRHSEQDYRAFLARVLQRLDDLRPWPEPPFYSLNPLTWPDLRDDQIVARIKLSTLAVERRLSLHFGRAADGGEVTVLRLPSGAELALVPGRWPDSKDVALLQRGSDRPAASVLDEFSAATGITAGEIEPQAPPSEGGTG